MKALDTADISGVKRLRTEDGPVPANVPINPPPLHENTDIERTEVDDSADGAAMVYDGSLALQRQFTGLRDEYMRMPRVNWFKGNETKLGYLVPVDIDTEWRHCRICRRDVKIIVILPRT